MELGDFSDFVNADPRKYFPVVYSRDEIRRVLENLRGTWQLMARLQYGCGLRISELCRLRVKDVDVEWGKLYVRAGKGDKDRMVPLPRSLREDWKNHLESIRQLHTQDREEGRPGVFLSGALDRKLPQAANSWEWFWVFPAKDLTVDPRHPGEPPRRHHTLPGVYQRHPSRAVRQASIAKESKYGERLRGVLAPRQSKPVLSLTDFKLAPYHLLTTRHKSHVRRDHRWHMEQIRQIGQLDPPFLRAKTGFSPPEFLPCSSSFSRFSHFQRPDSCFDL
ncbi:MAG: tyrosine-type recombinase/integrase [Puniceicoccaceae bacterium]